MLYWKLKPAPAFAVVLKFNPYHDKLGLFSSPEGGGGGGGFAAVGGGGAADYAANIQKDLAEARRITNAREKRRGAILDAHPEGATYKLGRTTYTKQTIQGDIFWVGPKKAFTSRQFGVELGTRLKDDG